MHEGVDYSKAKQHKCQLSARACSKLDILILLYIIVGCVCSQANASSCVLCGAFKNHKHTHTHTHTHTSHVCMYS